MGKTIEPEASPAARPGAIRRGLGGALTAALVVVTLITPIVLTLWVARSQGLAAARDRGRNYAGVVLAHTMQVRDQAGAALVQLSALAAKGESPCSDEMLQTMRKVDLSSTYIQAIGAVSGTTMVCASMEPKMFADLGPVDVTTPSGVEVRGDVHFAFSPNNSYMVFQKGPFAAIVNRELLLDPAADSTVLLGVFTPPFPRVDTLKGTIETSWVARALAEYPTATTTPVAQVHTFRSGNYLVSTVTSGNRYAGAVSAVPLSEVDDQIRHEAFVLAPVGLLCGLALAAAVLLLARRRTGFRSVLRGAFRRREFFLVFQPIVDLKSGVWVGAEALVRWNRRGGRTVRPDVFLPLITEYGFGQRLTREVLRLAAPALGELAREHPLAWLSVNLSGADLLDPSLVEHVRGLLEETGAHPEQLVLEITEHSFVDPDAARPLINQLHDLGVRVAIDDFGTGYSNLAQLERLDLDALKIDRSFIEPLGTQAATSQVAAHIIEMAREHGLYVVAEGVEQAAQADRLRRLDVQFAQGWLFSKPVSLEEFLAGYERTQRPVSYRELGAR